MAAPTISTPVSSNWADSSGNSAETTGSLSWGAGDLIIAMGVTEDNASATFSGVPTATGLTFSQVTVTNSNNNCKTYLWTATAAGAGSGAISASHTTGKACGLIVWAVSGTDGLGTPATITGSTAKTINITRTGANSGVVLIMGDWNAVNDTAVDPTPATNGTIDKADGIPSTIYTGFAGHWGDQGASGGPTAYGITNHTGTVKMTGIAVEVKGTAGGGGTDQTVTAVPADATGDVATPTLSAGSTVTAIPGDATGDAANPTVAAHFTATTPAADSTGDVANPTISAGSSRTSPPADATGDTANPTVTASSNIVAPAATARGSVPIPNVSGGGSFTVNAVPATAAGDIANPTLRADRILAAVVADATGDLPAPTLRLGATVLAAPATALAALRPPNVSDGSLADETAPTTSLLLAERTTTLLLLRAAPTNELQGATTAGALQERSTTFSLRD